MANLQISGSRYSPKYCDGLIASYASSTSLTLASGACSDSTGMADIIIPENLTINATVNGVNGLDTGTLGSSGFYYVYAIADSTKLYNSAAVISLSPLRPVMPYGYDLFRMVDIKATTPGSVFAVSYTTGGQVERTFTYDACISVLSNGNATSYTTINLNCVPLVGLTTVVLQYNLIPSVGGGWFKVRPVGSSSTMNTNYSSQVSGISAYELATCLATNNGSSTQIQYITASVTSLTLEVYSFTFSI